MSEPRSVRSASEFSHSLDDLRALVVLATEEARKLGASESEVGVSVDTGLSVTARLGEVETLEYQRDRGMGVTVYRGKRKGSASTADLTAKSIRDTVAKAFSIAGFTARWNDSLLLDESALALLDEVSFEIADLQGLILGQTNGKTVLIDTDAAGQGWFVDETPSDDGEFSNQLENGKLLSTDSTPAYGDMDLLTVVMHEMGHVIGLDHTPKNGQVYQIMNPTLDTGMRITLADSNYLVSDDARVKDKYQAPVNTSALSRSKVNNKVNTMQMQKTQTLVFDELMGIFSGNGKKQSLASQYYNQLKFDPSEWKEVRVSNRDNDSDWIIEV